MAAIVRTSRVVRRLLQNVRYCRPRVEPICFISTSKKNKDTAAVIEPSVVAKVKKEEVHEEKNWVSYGFSEESKFEDRHSFHLIFFTTITLGIVLVTFIMAYHPDFKLRDWTVRQAFLELHRREKAGLPLIDAELIDPKTIYLPLDEELENEEVII